jgi:hypothetical protein
VLTEPVLAELATRLRARAGAARDFRDRVFRGVP